MLRLCALGLEEGVDVREEYEDEKQGSSFDTDEGVEGTETLWLL